MVSNILDCPKEQRFQKSVIFFFNSVLSILNTLPFWDKKKAWFGGFIISLEIKFLACILAWESTEKTNAHILG